MSDRCELVRRTRFAMEIRFYCRSGTNTILILLLFALECSRSFNLDMNDNILTKRIIFKAYRKTSSLKKIFYLIDCIQTAKFVDNLKHLTMVIELNLTLPTKATINDWLQSPSSHSPLTVHYHDK